MYSFLTPVYWWNYETNENQEKNNVIYFLLITSMKYNRVWCFSKVSDGLLLGIAFKAFYKARIIMHRLLKIMNYVLETHK